MSKSNTPTTKGNSGSNSDLLKTLAPKGMEPAPSGKTKKGK